jgi:hypothetical protein
MISIPLIVALTQFLGMNADPFLQVIPATVIPTTTSPDARTGIASVYGYKGDEKWGGSRLACAQGYRVQTLPTMNVCAHRTHRCGTILAVENVRTGRRTLCRVLDRGPYGALLEDGSWVVKVKKSDPGTWRGITDLTPAVAAAIGHNGFEKVKTWVMYTPAKKMVVKEKAN